MDKSFIISNLSETPRRGMAEHMRKELQSDLGGHLLTFTRESWFPGIDDEIGWPVEHNEGFKPKWAARCKCSACCDEWYAGWAGAGTISMYWGDDGEFYPGVPEPEQDTRELTENDKVACPWCGEELTVVPISKLRHGRTYQAMVGSVENVGKYTALVAWLLTRRFNEYGREDNDVAPVMAVVIDEGGNLRGFSRVKFTCGGHMIPSDKWRALREAADPFQYRYYDYDSTNHTAVGGWMWKDVPEQLGQTGEKTGLADYVRSDGDFCFLYLRFWQNFPNIENLVKAGWTSTINAFIAQERDYALSRNERLSSPGELEYMAKWDDAKPTEMLYMTKNEVRQGYDWCWGMQEMMLWWNFVDYGNACRGDATEIQRLLGIYGVTMLEEFIDYVGGEGYREWNISDFDRYLAKQERRHGLRRRDGLRHMMDYRIILNRVIAEPTETELWPPDLRAAHDRIMRMDGAAAAAKDIAGFGRILAKWGALEWSDGHICAVLPKCNGDLVSEGHVLNHCVGGYGESHVKGKLVVFIRHARRPERSWFTLNIDTTTKSWKEIQLHGYGNEYAHGKKLHIPNEVRAFVDRWEREVLAPTFRQVREQEIEDAEAEALAAELMPEEQAQPRRPRRVRGAA